MNTIFFAQASSAERTPPRDFDTTANPILSRHWFGIEPLRPIGEAANDVVATPKRQRQVEHVCDLGPRAVHELLSEVAEGKNLDRALEAYGRLTLDLLQAVGGDRFPPTPIHEVS